MLTAKKFEHYTSLLDLDFSYVDDPRAFRSEKQEELSSLMTLLVMGISCKKRILREIETLSSLLGKKTKKAIGLKKDKVSDNCFYDCLKNTNPQGCDQAVIDQIKKALERKHVKNDLFPVGILTLDGKKTAHGDGQIPDGSVTKVTRVKTKKNAWRLHALRACLTSSKATPILGQLHLNNKKGESPAFRELFPSVVQAFPRLFQIITADAAFTNSENANLVLDKQKDYFFAVKGNQPTLLKAIEESFDNDSPCNDSSREYVNGEHVSRHIYTTALPSAISFPGAAQIIWIRQRKYKPSTDEFSCEDRYFISSIPFGTYNNNEMLKLIRLHWGIENGSNWTCDVIFDEDTHFPCNKGYGPSVTSWLQVIAFNVISIVRSLCFIKPKTSRGKKIQQIAFNDLIQWLFLFLVHDYFANRGAEKS